MQAERRIPFCFDVQVLIWGCMKQGLTINMVVDPIPSPHDFLGH
jgi:hypothetical protein